MLGSGWLFAPYQAAHIAGPAALLSWVIGAVIVCLLALCFAEIAALYPRRGLSAIIPLLSHNRYFAFPFAIANWLGVVAVIALEADATTEYLIHLAPSLRPLLFHHHHLTWIGNGISVILVLLFGLMNYWGSKTLIKANNIFTIFKILIPLFICLLVIFTSFHPQNFHNDTQSFAPYGYRAIFTAILSSGIVVAFNGFQTVISFANEIHKPARTIPLAVVIAVVVCLGIYLLLQTAFIGGLPPAMVAKGWNQLNFYAPVLQLMGAIGLGFYTSVAYFGATVAPVGSGIAFAGTSSRMFTAMSENKQMPIFFHLIHPNYGISRRSLIFNVGLALCFLLLFRSWANLAQVLGLLHIISYLPVPIALWALRGKIRDNKFPFLLPLGKTIACFLFVFFTYLITLGDPKTVTEVIAIFFIFIALYLMTIVRSLSQLGRALKHLWFLTLYFISLTLLTWLSPPHMLIYSVGEHLAIVVLISLLFFMCFLTTTRRDIVIKDSALMKKKRQP